MRHVHSSQRDAGLDSRRIRPARSHTHSDTAYRLRHTIALSRNSSLSHPQTHESAIKTGRALRADRATPDELALICLDRPANTRLERIDVGKQLVAVQRVRRLKPQNITRA